MIGQPGADGVAGRIVVGQEALVAHRVGDSDIGTAVAGGEIWIALDSAGMPVSMEEKLRGGDKKVKGFLMVDTLREVDAETMGARLSNQFSTAEVGVFRVLCQLGRADL